ncbi:SsgA family sporulation/cell division regulator [Streptomyces sp. NPDC093516]|uniref:SsgA family sporulation/cell division regulator n=1 Tax=Streptomyces sp. NPDC093516 TaxID=3155304 RepID=UPI0034424B35
MSSNQSGGRTARTETRSSHELVLGIERVLNVSARQPVRAQFRFDTEFPLIIGVEFLIEDGPRALWRIGRDLLQQGLYSVSGLGDVQMWPAHLEDRAIARLRLASGNMAALFELPIPPLAEWLEDTYRAVPAAQELSGLDWEGATADLFQEGAAHRSE